LVSCHGAGSSSVQRYASLSCYSVPCDLLSFPTRRSSDLSTLQLKPGDSLLAGCRALVLVKSLASMRSRTEALVTTEKNTNSEIFTHMLRITPKLKRSSSMRKNLTRVIPVSVSCCIITGHNRVKKHTSRQPSTT